MSSSIYYRILGYTVTLVTEIYTFYDIKARLSVTTKDPVVAKFATLQTKFLTIWTYAVVIMYAAIGLYCDYRTLVNKNDSLAKKLGYFRQIFFSSLIWPLCCFVTLLFWPIYIFDVGLLFPPYIDKILSNTNNLVLHLYILVFAFWELVFLPRVERNRAFNLGILIAFLVAYLIVFFSTYIQTGQWLYPIFKHIYGTLYFPLFFILTIVLMVFVYFIQWPLNKFVWGKSRKEKIR